MIWLIIKQLIVIFVLITCFIYVLSLLLKKRNFGRRIENKNVCLIVAHPDDECMFFGPVMRLLSNSKNKIYVLCMTRGDFYKKGNLRVNEMTLSCDVLIGQIALTNLKIIDEPSRIPDHPSEEWDLELAQKLITDYILNYKIDSVITFDEHGISSHVNHCCLSKLLSLVKRKTSIDLYELTTVNLIRKYLFLFDLIPALVLQCFHANDTLLAMSSLNDYALTLKAMMKHNSQLVWFRWLYIFSSRYMLFNSIKLIK